MDVLMRNWVKRNGGEDEGEGDRPRKRGEKAAAGGGVHIDVL